MFDCEDCGTGQSVEFDELLRMMLCGRCADRAGFDEDDWGV